MYFQRFCFPNKINQIFKQENCTICISVCASWRNGLEFYGALHGTSKSHKIGPFPAAIFFAYGGIFFLHLAPKILMCFQPTPRKCKKGDRQKIAARFFGGVLLCAELGWPTEEKNFSRGSKLGCARWKRFVLRNT